MPYNEILFGKQMQMLLQILRARTRGVGQILVESD